MTYPIAISHIHYHHPLSPQICKKVCEQAWSIGCRDWGGKGAVSEYQTVSHYTKLPLTYMGKEVTDFFASPLIYLSLIHI